MRNINFAELSITFQKCHQLYNCLRQEKWWKFILLWNWQFSPYFVFSLHLCSVHYNVLTALRIRMFETYHISFHVSTSLQCKWHAYLKGNQMGNTFSWGVTDNFSKRKTEMLRKSKCKQKWSFQGKGDFTCLCVPVGLV